MKLYRTLGKILAVVFGLALLGLMAIVGSALLSSQIPSDEEMKTFYRQKQAALDAVRRSVLSGKNDLAEKVTAVTKDGWYEYQKPKGAMHIYTHRTGIGVGAVGAGLAYLSSQPAQLFAGIDAAVAASVHEEGFRGYVPLDEGWYYFYWEAD